MSRGKNISEKYILINFLANKEKKGLYYWINQNEGSWDPEHNCKKATTEVGAILRGRVLGAPKCVDDKKQEQKWDAKK